MKENYPHFYAENEGSFFQSSLGYYKIYFLDESLLGIRLSSSYEDIERVFSGFAAGFPAFAMGEWIGKWSKNEYLKFISWMIIWFILLKIITFLLKRFSTPSYRKKQKKEEIRYEAMNFDIQKMLGVNKRNFLIKLNEIKDAGAMFSYETNYAEIFLTMTNKKKYHFVASQVPVMAQLHDLLSKSIQGIEIETE